MAWHTPGMAPQGRGAGWMDRHPQDAFVGFLFPPGQEMVAVRDATHGKKIWGKKEKKRNLQKPVLPQPKCLNVGHPDLVQTIKVWFKSHRLVATAKLLCFPSLVSALKIDLR